MKTLRRFWRDFAELGVLAAAVLGLAFGLGWCASDAQDDPDCPTEDSCYPEYEDGDWTIIEGERPQAGVAVPVEGTPTYVG